MIKNQNQDHFCGGPPKTIDAYIAAQPESVQPPSESGPGYDPGCAAGGAGAYFVEYADLLE